MEPVGKPESDTMCFRFMNEEELDLYSQDKKLPVIESEFGNLIPRAAEKQEKLFVVPTQFPFIFQILNTHFARSSVEEIHSILKKLNTLRRVQIVRSMVSRRIISLNMQSLHEKANFPGCITITQSDPFSGQILKVTKNQLNFINIAEGCSALVDFKQQEGADTKQVHELRRKLSLFHFEVELKHLRRSRKGLLYYKNLRKVKKLDLFYCFLKVTSELVLKLYFSLGCDESRELTFLVLSIIQVISAERTFTTCKLRRPGFSETVEKAKLQSSNEVNYRFNVIADNPVISNKKLLAAHEFKREKIQNETESSNSDRNSFKNFVFRKKSKPTRHSANDHPSQPNTNPESNMIEPQESREKSEQNKDCLPASGLPLQLFDSKSIRHKTKPVTEIKSKYNTRPEESGMLNRAVQNSKNKPNLDTGHQETRVKYSDPLLCNVPDKIPAKLHWRSYCSLISTKLAFEMAKRLGDKRLQLTDGINSSHETRNNPSLEVKPLHFEAQI